MRLGELLLNLGRTEMLHSNCHTHTVFCDGADSPEMWAARFVRETKQYQRIS